MEQDLSTQAHRSRLAQFMAWLRGDQAQTQQAPQQNSDRQVADGTPRGNEAPDVRRAMQETVQTFRDDMHAHRKALDQREPTQRADDDPSERTSEAAYLWRYGTMEGYDALQQDVVRRRAEHVARLETTAPPHTDQEAARLTRQVRRTIERENLVPAARVLVREPSHGSARSEDQPQRHEKGLRAALEAAQQRFEEQQRSQDRQHGRER